MNSLRSAILRLFDRMHFGLLRKKYIDDEHRIAFEEFIKWLLKKSVHNLYPSAPYERKATAIEILLCATNVTSSLQTEEIDNGYARVLTEELLQNQDATRVLLKASLDSFMCKWDENEGWGETTGESSYAFCSFRSVDVDVEGEKLTLLAPSPTPPPSMVLIKSSIKWTDS